MMVFLALVGALCAGGILLIRSGLRPRPATHWSLTLPREVRRSPLVRAGVLGLAGILVALLTGWVIAIPLLPIVGLSLRSLVGKSPGHQAIVMMEAMEEWTRGLAGILAVGSGLEQALMATLGSTPPPMKPAVTRLVVRLKARWTTTNALREFAEDLDDPTGDLIAATLILGAQRRGDGLATILEDLSHSVAGDIRGRRQVEADMAKPRATSRWVTIITAVVLLVLFLQGDYIAAYKTGLGQMILCSLLCAYAAVMVWMKKMTHHQFSARFLPEHVGQGV